MPDHETPAVAFLAFLVALIVGMVLVFGQERPAEPDWTPATNSPPVTTEVP